MARARKTITPDPYAKPIAKPLPPSKSLPGKLKQFQAPTRADFDLVSPYGAAGDQPKAIEELTEGFKNGEQFQTLLGVTGSGKTFTMANVIKNSRTTRRSPPSFTKNSSRSSRTTRWNTS